VAPGHAGRRATLEPFGGVGTVTGSKFLLTAGGRRVLLDCGLFQGLKALRLRNWAPFPFEAEHVAAVVLSHAHIDHSGALPLLARRGFAGPVHCTAGTQSLLGVLLEDAAKLQEEEAAFANRHGTSKHHPALPLYGREDAEAALALVRPHAYGQPIPLAPGVSAVFRHAGHILGSATVEVLLEGRERCRLVYSGDLGRWDRPILRDPEPVEEADVLLLESTYGDRVHAPDAAAALAEVVRDAAARGGALLVPAFAVGRVQELIWTLRHLEDEGRIPSLPVFLDSPMAIDVTEIYCRHPEEHDLDMRLLRDARRCPLCCRQYRLVRTVPESQALNGRQGPMIVIAGSGMLTGGRILQHLKHRADDERTTILLPGFQAEGTRGRALQEGARELRIHGRTVPVRARVVTLDGFSAHADREEILRWLAGFRRPPRRTFLVHGEPAATESLAATIRERLGWRVDLPMEGQTIVV
jgi:metallo-beta-lactamase family protein